MEKEYDIFISYGRDEHKKVAEKIRDDLKEKGYRVWFDAEKLKVGPDWEAAIEQGLIGTAEAKGKVIFIITPHSARRPDGYCLNELALALQKYLPVIPVMLIDTVPPLSICRLQYLDIRQAYRDKKIIEGEYEKQLHVLVEAIKNPKYLDSEGTQSKLLQLLNPINFDAEVRNYIKDFVGRTWVFRKVDEWMHDPNGQKLFWIMGFPGTGKSAIAAWIRDNRPEVKAFHFCDFSSQEKRDSKRLVCSVAYQLSTQLAGEYGAAYRDTLGKMNLQKEIEEYDAYTLFDKLIVEPLSSNIQNEEGVVVVLIDAIDEATLDGKNEIVNFLRKKVNVIPQWLKFLITSRPETEITSRLQSYGPFILDIGSEDNRKDLFEYLKMKLPEINEEQCDFIVAKSEGVFLYIREVCNEVQLERLSLDRLNEFPQGLGDVYGINFDRKFGDDPDIYKDTVKPFLEIALASYEPLNVEFLMECVDYDQEEFDDVKDRLGSLFVESEENYLPFHKSIVDWITKKSAAGEWTLYLKNGHKVLAEKLLEEIPEELENYRAHFIGYHMCEAKRKLVPDEVNKIETEFLDGKEQNTLHFAVRDGQAKVVSYLLKQGFQVEVTDRNGIAPIHLAAQNGNIEMMGLLYENGASLEIGDSYGVSVFHYAAMNGHVGVVDYLLKHGMDVETRNNNGMTIALVAAMSNQLEMLKYLKMNGADIESKTYYGDSLMHYASWCNNSSIVKYLQSQGVSLRTQNYFGTFPLNLVVESGHEELERYFISQGVQSIKTFNYQPILSNNVPDIFKTVVYGDLEKLKFLREQGGDIFIIFNGTTLIHEAAYRGHLDILDYLLEQGLEIEIKDVNGETPIYSAVWGCQLKMVKYLSDNRASIGVNNVNGFTLLHVASRVGDLDITRYFIELGEDVMIKDKLGLTPLHLASRGGHMNVVRYLVSKGADVNSKNSNGTSVVFMASPGGYVDVIDYLRKNGANLEDKDFIGLSLIHEAVICGNISLVKYLINHGVDVNLKMKNGATPLSLAEIYGRQEVFEYLRNQRVK